MPPTAPEPYLPSPCWSHLGTIFRSWALLRRILCFLLRLLSFLAGFYASWGALARFWRVLKGSGDGFGGPKALFCEVFLPAHACNAKKT